MQHWCAVRELIGADLSGTLTPLRSLGSKPKVSMIQVKERNKEVKFIVLFLQVLVKRDQVLLQMLLESSV